MNSNDLEKLVNTFNAISSLSVSGDAVDLIAMARQNLSSVIDKLSKELKDPQE